MDDIQRHRQVLQRGLERIQARTPAQRKAFLRRIGILDEKGRLAKRYRSEVDAQPLDDHGTLQ